MPPVCCGGDGCMGAWVMGVQFAICDMQQEAICNRYVADSPTTARDFGLRVPE
jgi:hypothetical protein